MKHKIYHNLAIAGFSLIVLIWLLIMFWCFYPYKTVDVLTQPYIVTNHDIKKGDNLEYIIDYCRYTKVIPTVVRQFQDGIIFTAPETRTQLPYGCGTVKVAVEIPSTLPAGTYELKVFTSFKVNPIRNITSEYETEQFSVIK